MADLRIARHVPPENGGVDDDAAEGRTRRWVARGFTRIEDVVYVGLGLLLAAIAVALLGFAAVDFATRLVGGGLPGYVVQLLDRVLLVLLIVEILLTVQVSFREHALVPEPFLIVGLIAATRRILVLTAEFDKLIRDEDAVFRNSMLELGLLTVMVLVLVISLVLLRKRAPQQVAEKA
jgi:hypothetical protein